jgi:(p)ppGpp synthase/HD superfamily hydrolase
MMSIIHEAAKLARTLHHDQTRAGGQPYIEHPMRVAGLVSIHGDDDKDTPFTDDMVAAAWLHDVYEDTEMWSPFLACISPEIEHLVDELTNRYTKENCSKMNRAKRKKAETRRIAVISPRKHKSSNSVIGWITWIPSRLRRGRSSTPSIVMRPNTCWR